MAPVEKNNFEALIQPDRYQVFLMASRASVPIMFASHPWFVINKKGAVDRWGLGWQPTHYGDTTHWGHLGRNVLPPFRGLQVLYFSTRWYWPSRVLGMVEGGEHSLAAAMIACIEQTPQTYPYKNRYSFLGPNSNTYAQWVLRQFPQSGLRLPWNAFGKRYK